MSASISPFVVPKGYVLVTEPLSEGKEEKKLVIATPAHDSVVVEPPSLDRFGLAAAKPAFGNKVYRIRMTRTASLTSSGGGVMNLTTGLYPSQFSQGSAFAALFDQCRLCNVKYSYTSRVGSGAALIWASFATAFDPNGSAATTYTFDQTVRLPGSIAFSLAQTNWPSRTRLWNLPKNRPWSLSSTTGGGGDPVGGGLGAISHSISNVVSISTTYVDYFVESVWEFRNPF